ncbi:hypothetical protein E3N88_13420 [Mikania micrantha]|uniref:Retroviral polymerase SH3-like domain-containing protein n=1 Tax=Mikania micrantha TaxID=192012 RepID=A0A5N6P8B9_9ASTR|nr:hypothetical protein E3N88_13420 [Mikania micrantha]
MDFRSTSCVFLGYSTAHHGYRCLDHVIGRLYIARHVRFKETSFPFSSTPHIDPPIQSSDSPYFSSYPNPPVFSPDSTDQTPAPSNTSPPQPTKSSPVAHPIPSAQPTSSDSPTPSAPSTLSAQPSPAPSNHSPPSSTSQNHAPTPPSIPLNTAPPNPPPARTRPAHLRPNP